MKDQGFWISDEIDSNFRRIGCIELLDPDHRENPSLTILKSKYAAMRYLLEQASYMGIPVSNIAMTVFGTGEQQIELQYMACVLWEQLTLALQSIDSLTEINIYEFDPEKASLLESLLRQIVLPEEGKPGIFISYSSKQFSEAESIKNVIEQNGYRCWMAPNSIPAGSSYIKEIPRALSNADIIAKSLDEILAKTGAEKVNILAHSKGGLEARYLINHGYADKVASVTTIDTPHHGSKTVDFLMRAPKWMVKTAAWGTDVWMKILGDKNPDSYDCFDLFTTRTAEQFNIDNPAPDNIYCQSYAFKCRGSFSDPVFCITYPVVRRFDGDNDGLVSVASAKWANFKGVLTTPSYRGVSHADVVDIRRRKLTSRAATSECEVTDITNFYVDIVKELKEMGY